MTLDRPARDYLDSLKPPSTPLPDADQPRWSWLHSELGNAEAPRLLREALYLLQSAGVTFEPAGRGMRMVRGECTERIYEVIREELLAKHAAILTPILQRMRRD